MLSLKCFLSINYLFQAFISVWTFDWLEALFGEIIPQDIEVNILADSHFRCLLSTCRQMTERRILCFAISTEIKHMFLNRVSLSAIAAMPESESENLTKESDIRLFSCRFCLLRGKILD